MLTNCKLYGKPLDIEIIVGPLEPQIKSIYSEPELNQLLHNCFLYYTESYVADLISIHYNATTDLIHIKKTSSTTEYQVENALKAFPQEGMKLLFNITPESVLFDVKLKKIICSLNGEYLLSIFDIPRKLYTGLITCVAYNWDLNKTSPIFIYQDAGNLIIKSYLHGNSDYRLNPKLLRTREGFRAATLLSTFGYFDFEPLTASEAERINLSDRKLGIETADKLREVWNKYKKRDNVVQKLSEIISTKKIEFGSVQLDIKTIGDIKIAGATVVRLSPSNKLQLNLFGSFDDYPVETLNKLLNDDLSGVETLLCYTSGRKEM